MTAHLAAFFLAAITLLSLSSGLAGPSGLATNAPAAIELGDQYGVARRLTFPATKLTVITIADRKGSDQVDGWIEALTSRYDGRIDLRGIANLAGAPGFVHDRIRKKFQEKHKHPVMMDWSGGVCDQLGNTPGLANIIIVGSGGEIRGRFAGAAVQPLLGKVITALDQALLPKP